MHPLHVTGGSSEAPALLFYPGNGFPPDCYSPLLNPLTARWRVLTLPPRALWTDPGPAPLETGSLGALVDDLLAGMEAHDLREVVAVGHSLGALVLMLALLEQPKRFRGLALLDPAILSRERIEFVQMMRAQGELRQIPIVDGALRRRHRFPDEQEAFAYWRQKTFFAEFSDEALWVYTRAATRPAADGEGLELTWPRDQEASYFMLSGMDVRDSLVWLNNVDNTLVVQGAGSDVLTADSLQRLHLHLPQATIVTVPDSGHLFPLSHPQETRGLLSSWLNTVT